MLESFVDKKPASLDPDDGDASYRRGYHQAYETAIEHIRAGVTLDQMCRHGDVIQAWRERSPRGFASWAPPGLGDGDPSQL